MVQAGCTFTIISKEGFQEDRLKQELVLRYSIPYSNLIYFRIATSFERVANI